MQAWYVCLSPCEARLQEEVRSAVPLCCSTTHIDDAFSFRQQSFVLLSCVTGSECRCTAAERAEDVQVVGLQGS